MLTSKQRAKLRGMASHTEPIFQIGKGGISEESCLQIGHALEARELIKVRVLGNSDSTAAQAADMLARATGAEVVTVTGATFVLYRESSKKKRIFFDE
ncbi:MAG: ribosome assembly RNA-binding protein YhbY [Eubacteriales bacterium]